MSDLVERLVGVAEFVVGEPRAALYEAVKEIERLRSLTRFQDGVIRSGDVACLTDLERASITRAIETLRGIEYLDAFSVENDATAAATLRGLLERLANKNSLPAGQEPHR
jgi:hypothetical protein